MNFLLIQIKTEFVPYYFKLCLFYMYIYIRHIHHQRMHYFTKFF